MDKYLEILITHYGYACQLHETAIRHADPYSPHGASEINERSATMTSRMKDIEKYIDDNYVRKV